jgi:Spy/CpxP family protein refolding chaperone
MHGPHSPHGEFAWWKNSDTVSKLGLNDNQVKQLDQTFVQHKMKLIDDMATMQKADLSLHSLLDADSPDQSQVMAAVDQVLAARGTVERETTMMMLDMRKVLTVDQWKQLRAMHPMGPGFGGPNARRGQMRGKRSGAGAPDGAPPASPDGGSPQQD